MLCRGLVRRGNLQQQTAVEVEHPTTAGNGRPVDGVDETGWREHFWQTDDFGPPFGSRNPCGCSHSGPAQEWRRVTAMSQWFVVL